MLPTVCTVNYSTVLYIARVTKLFLLIHESFAYCILTRIDLHYVLLTKLERVGETLTPLNQ